MCKTSNLQVIGLLTRKAIPYPLNTDFQQTGLWELN